MPRKQNILTQLLKAGIRIDRLCEYLPFSKQRLYAINRAGMKPHIKRLIAKAAEQYARDLIATARKLNKPR